ncbi:MAG: alpha-ketoglutarate-dependent dioxygenase AlkB [Paracoccaceae bacterium]
MTTPLMFQGAEIWKSQLDRAAQVALVAELRDVAKVAPFRNDTTPGGQKMTVRMSGAGDVSWTSSRAGYVYAETQSDGRAWPRIPVALVDLWHTLTALDQAPDSCLVNFYGEGARMGLHQDRDECDTSWPVVSVSLGDEAQFRVGGPKRSDPTKSIWLSSGDIVVLKGPSRLAYHGIDRIKFGSSALLERGGRLNVTLRVAL